MVFRCGEVFEDLRLGTVSLLFLRRGWQIMDFGPSGKVMVAIFGLLLLYANK
jgi:hypothetical protein